MCDVLDLLRRLDCTGGVKANVCPAELTDTHPPENSTVNILTTVGSIATYCTSKQLKIARAILQSVAKDDPTVVLKNYNLALSRPSIMINDNDINAFGNVIIPFTFVSEIIRSMTETTSSDDLNHYVQNQTLEYLKTSETSFQTLVLSSLISFIIKLRIREDSSSISLLFVNNLLKALFNNKSHAPPLVVSRQFVNIIVYEAKAMFTLLCLTCLYAAFFLSAFLLSFYGAIDENPKTQSP
ncbi:hypothetical protein PHET_12336 [Paragonimus heterotremus]|uniref:Uncharacterized protein n=1 Tax=Paragonimus heterotremus TaxID=100268 RepID=A0A8J4SXX6_9TREM|nr:hypothetical protein PHET_12336 [Paragonimus heterotremus]